MSGRSPRLVCSMTIGTRTMPPPSCSSSELELWETHLTSFGISEGSTFAANQRGRRPCPGATRRGGRRFRPPSPSARAGSPAPRPSGRRPRLNSASSSVSATSSSFSAIASSRRYSRTRLGAGPGLLGELRPASFSGIHAARREVARVFAQREGRLGVDERTSGAGISWRERSVSRMARTGGAGRLFLESQPRAHLVAQGCDRVAVRDGRRELVVDGRQALLLERREGDLVVERSFPGSPRWGSRPGSRGKRRVSPTAAPRRASLTRGWSRDGRPRASASARNVRGASVPAPGSDVGTADVGDG